MSDIRLAVVGCGVLGSRHAELYTKIPGVKLVCVVDHHADRAQALAKNLGVRHQVNTEGFHDQIDAVSVCTPAISHYEVSKPLLEAGMHILVEKPITTTVEHADELVHIANEKGLVLQTGHIERFNGAISTVKEIIQDPLFIECDRIGLFDPRISDVGVVLDLMIHDLDVVMYMVNSKVKEVKAFGMNVLSNTEDFANCRLVFENGTICNLTASRMAQKRSRKIRIFEKHRYISLDYYRQEARTFTKQIASSSETIYRPIDIRKTNPLDDELRDFINCIRQKTKPRVKPQEAREALSIALQVLSQIQHSNPS